MRSASSIREMRRAVGQFALEVATVPESERHAVIASRLPSPRWPAWALRIVAGDDPWVQETVGWHSPLVTYVSILAPRTFPRYAACSDAPRSQTRETERSYSPTPPRSSYLTAT
jgi:hypothetical protein